MGFLQTSKTVKGKPFPEEESEGRELLTIIEKIISPKQMKLLNLIIVLIITLSYLQPLAFYNKNNEFSSKSVVAFYRHISI